MDRIHILDGHGYVFRAHFGLMGSSRNERREVRLSTSEGMPTGALYVFARMLIRLHEDLHPERIAVVFDAGRKSFRTEIFPEYKAHRPPPPEDLAIQMPYFRKIVDGMNWPVLAVPGVEADDVIATLVTQARARGWEAVVYSADKDLMQLVGEGVTMIDALRATTYTREEVIKKFGVPPEQVADFLALTGDTSDNIPGLSGVGDKTAATLLATYGSIARMIEENPVVPRLKIRQPFGDPEQLARVRLSRMLVELNRKVALPIPLEDLKAAATWDTSSADRAVWRARVPGAGRQGRAGRDAAPMVRRRPPRVRRRARARARRRRPQPRRPPRPPRRCRSRPARRRRSRATPRRSRRSPPRSAPPGAAR